VTGTDDEITADLIAELLREQHPDLAACWILLPDGVTGRFHHSYSPAADAATLRRARGWALTKALACLLIGDAGVRGRPGGKATWGPPAAAALQRLTATRPSLS
jgi:hypothetical protein